MSRSAAAIAGLVAALALVGSASPVGGATPKTEPSSGCVLLADLEPSCGVVLGAYPTSFGGDNIAERFDNFNNASGSTLSAAREYKRQGQRLSRTDRLFAQTPGALLAVTWKPASHWADADGGDAEVNEQILKMARSVKKLGQTKIMMTIYHEPERSVSGGASGCSPSIYRGDAGTPEQYRAMWSNVEAVFAAHHVTNVVWAMNYVGYPTWNCMLDDLWPGNNLVDWVLWDPYTTASRSFSASVGELYSALTQQSDPANDYLSKPWGLGEFGDDAPSTATQNSFYSTIKAALDAGEFPKLKLLLAFDAKGHLGDARIAYNASGHYDAAELADFARLDQDPAIAAGRDSVDGGQTP